MAKDITSKRKRVEKELRESEGRFDAVFDQAAVGIVLSASDGRWLRANRKLGEILGYEEDELAALRFPSIVHPDDLESHLGFQVQLEAGEISVSEGDIRLLRKDGSITWGYVTTSLTRDAEGKPDYYVTVIEHVWRRAELREKLKTKEARFRDIAEAATDRFWEMDENLRFTSMFDHPGGTVYPPPETFIGRTRWEMAGVDPDKDEKWGKHRDDHLAHRPFRDFQFAITDEDGVSHYRSISGKPFFDGEGNFRGYRGSATNITDRVQMETRIHQLAASIEDLSEIFALYDADDRLVSCNKGFRDLNRDIPESTKSGVPYEDHLRATVEKGLVAEAAGRKEDWIRERLERHRNPGEPFEVARDDGRCFLVKEQCLPGGATATIGIEITQRKQAEKALKESEERYRTLIESSNVIAWEVELESGRFTYVSTHAVDLLGYTLDEWYVEGFWADHIHPEDREQSVKICKDATERGEDHNFEYRMIAADGRSVWLRDIVTVVMEGGRPVSLRGFMIDITERKLAETKLRESEEWFRALFENLPLSIHIKDTQGRYLLANNAYITRTGKSLDEIQGKTAFDFFPEDVANNFTALDREVFDSGQAIVQETELPTPFDGLRNILVTKFPIFGLDGAPEAVGAINFDTTDRKQAEEAIKKSQARLSGILDIAPEAIIAIDDDMNIQLFNQGAERVFGYSTDEVLGQPLEMLMPEYFRKDHHKLVEEFDGSGDTYRLIDQRQEIIGLRKDGTEFPASASVSKLDIGGEKIFTVMMRDITERKYTQEALLAAKMEAETANRAKSEFLANMSHELRTPLNAILGFADILSNQYFGPTSEKYKEYAEDIEASGEHLLTLVNEILDLSTIEAGKQSLVKEKLSTMEIVRECERIIEERARSLGIDLITEIPKNLPPLYADRRAFKQILLNLLSNAVKFTPEGGRITVSAKASKRNTTLKIADTGKGIPANKLPKLTDPFTRMGGDPYVAEQGWGLGLTITKSLIDLHDGTLDIKSKVGKGTTVTVTFPNGAP